MTRRHHPLEGQTFEVLKVGKKDLLVQLRDGSTIKLPRSWTDADGATALEAGLHRKAHSKRAICSPANLVTKTTSVG